jgi:hypothetical protein
VKEQITAEPTNPVFQQQKEHKKILLAPTLRDRMKTSSMSLQHLLGKLVLVL